MIARKHSSGSGTILSLCDDDLIGKKYSEGGLVLDLSSDFYRGDIIDDRRAAEECKRAYIVNAVGERAVSLLKELGLVSEKNIVMIGGIPFSQCLIIENEI